MKIYAFHLLNDFSGSPKVLKQLATGWVAKGFDVNIVTSKGKDGFLSEIDGVTYHQFWYSWAPNPFLRLLNLIISQLSLIGLMLFKLKRKDIVYVNTVLPFGAAIVGKIIGCRIIYHMHETSMKPVILKKVLFGIANWAASDAVYVSNYLLHQENLGNVKKHLLYNAIENDFLETALRTRKTNENSKNVLLVCSLKEYKGVVEYVNLARDNSEYSFRMILNSTDEDISRFFMHSIIPDNLEILSTKKNLHPYYNWADVIVNLSRPDGWIETFGLTVIEGMAYGLPAIVPPVGGITELVEDGENGYKVDCRDSALLNNKLKQILDYPATYRSMVDEAKKKISDFKENVFIEKSVRIITG